VFPASRGCIRIAPEDAAWFSAWGPYNKPIVVLPWDSGTGREG
jgi:lipoprotein-anchoring transpeptidase ErfK/SrfK